MNGAEVLVSGQDDLATFICRCEEVTSEEVVAALAAGAVSLDDVKRRTRAGMGLCQGIYCMPVIAAMVAQATGVAVDRLAPMTTRPPVRVIPLEDLAVLAPVDAGED
jgi:NAD(P)H-nitrite reductase large subunit